MPTDVEQLAEMGFPTNRAEKALSKTGYKGVQVAMDWLLAHMDDPDIDDPFEAPKGYLLTDPPPNAEGGGAEGEASSSEGVPLAKSLKCDECGRLLKTESDVQIHAGRTGHSSFSESTEEIKPLSEEERKAQLAQVQQLLKQKRVEKEEKEKQESLAREKARRVQGKEMIQMKQKLEEEEMKKLVEQRRREKEEEKKAKLRVREQIEKDKKDRLLKFGAGSSVDGGEVGSQAKVEGAATARGQTTAVGGPSATSPSSSGPKEYTATKLQIRLPSGDALTQTFQAREELSAVRLYVSLNRKDGDSAPFTFRTTFPNRTFSEDDMCKPLHALDLVPSAVLIVARLAA